jgi:hypothetical protein
MADADEAGLQFNEIEPGVKKLRVKKKALIKNIQNKICNMRVSP